MSEDSEEAMSVWKSSQSTSVVTEDRSDCDPTEPSDWESNESMVEVDQPEKVQSNSPTRAPLHVEVKRSWSTKFTEVVETKKMKLSTEKESNPSMEEENSSNSSKDSDSESSSDDYDDSDESDRESKAKKSFYPLEDTINVETPYHLHPQDQRFVEDKIFLFWYPKVDIEAHRRRMAGRMVPLTIRNGELRIIRPTLWVIDLHDEGKRNLVGSFKICGITICVWLSHYVWYHKVVAFRRFAIANMQILERLCRSQREKETSKEVKARIFILLQAHQVNFNVTKGIYMKYAPVNVGSNWFNGGGGCQCGRRCGHQ
ncbi:hypothetical protein LguiB_032186 [Lonicera macranthoides]